MKHRERIVSVLLAVLLMVCVLPTSVYAESENTPKEEVVYINLNSHGSVKEINVVNIFDLDKNGQIIDYGKYKDLRNMTTTDKIDYSDERVTIDTKAHKLYYEGKLDNNVIPWNIAIRYYMDGKEYSADEIAGKSGNLKIKMEITDNKKCKGDFFEGCALQATVVLDTKKCNNILADGATIANVGSDKQLTYTVLPNKGADIEITANVTDFEMSGIAINGVKLNLAIEIDDAEIQSKIDEIIGAVNDLDEGAGELNNGSNKLYNGTTTLNDKVGELYNGVGALDSGVGDLSSVLAEITTKNKELLDGAYSAFKGICSASETVLNTELSKNGLKTVTLSPKNYDKVLNELLKTMDTDSVYTMAYNKALEEVTAKVNANIDEIYAGYVEQNVEAIYLSYIQSQADTLYAQVATQAVLEQLVASGYSNKQATAYLQTDEGQVLIAQAVSAMTEKEKQKIITTAVSKLTENQKTQIKEGAIQSLTDEQKKQIKNGYIDQTMKSKEVTDEITKAVNSANSAVASISELKGQLDNYSLFYEGLKEYTSAVSSAASGANTLKLNMNTLYANVGTLKTSVGDLNDGVKALFDGTKEMKDGTAEFVNETTDMNTIVSDEIDSMISSVSGDDVKLTSFVSEKNTNVKSVQFVIKTEAIEIPETVDDEPVVEEKLNFWQKLLRLFGL